MPKLLCSCGKLRIVWSVMFSLATVLLIALWAGSYWRLQILEKRTGLQAVQISSVKGHIAIARLDPQTAIGKSYLSVVAGDAADWRKGGVLGFAYYDDRFLTALVAPHWLLAFLCSALAVGPWISPGRRFSLRTLLVATTLIAAALGLIVRLNHH
jgi:hypothetical protein